MTITELNRFPEEAIIRGKDINRLADLLLGNDGAQVKLMGHDGTVKDVNTGATTSTGAYTQLIQNTGGNHVAVLLAATSATATPSAANSAVLIQDAGLSIGNGKALQLYNAAGTNLANLYHSGTNDVIKSDDSLWTTGALIVGPSLIALGAGDMYLAGKAYINATSNALMTIGMTIDQGAADDQILSLQSSDVAHGITSLLGTSTFGAASKASATAGGLLLRGATEATTACSVVGYATTDDTTKATTSAAHVMVGAATKSGTTVAAPAANTNLLAVFSNATHAIIDQEGDLHLDSVSANNVWDDEEDVALLEAYRLTTMRDEPPSFRRLFADDIAAQAETLARTGVITLNDDGHHFVSVKGLFGLTIDSIRQVYGRLRETQQRVETLEHRLLALESPA